MNVHYEFLYRHFVSFVAKFNIFVVLLIALK